MEMLQESRWSGEQLYPTGNSVEWVQVVERALVSLGGGLNREGHLHIVGGECYETLDSLGEWSYPVGDGVEWVQPVERALVSFEAASGNVDSRLGRSFVYAQARSIVWLNGLQGL
jgi:hypothetical protein